jgi:hypothetical protein
MKKAKKRKTKERVNKVKTTITKQQIKIGKLSPKRKSGDYDNTVQTIFTELQPMSYNYALYFNLSLTRFICMDCPFSFVELHTTQATD